MTTLFMDLSISQRLRAWMWAFMVLVEVAFVALGVFGFKQSIAPLFFIGVIGFGGGWLFFSYVLDCVKQRRAQNKRYADMSPDEKAAVEELRRHLGTVFLKWQMTDNLELRMPNDQNYVVYLQEAADNRLASANFYVRSRCFDPFVEVLISEVEWKSLRGLLDGRLEAHRQAKLALRVAELQKLAQG